MVLKPLPTFEESCTISVPAVINAIVSSNELFATAIAEDEFFKAVMMSAFVRAKLLPTKLTLSIICDRTSSLEIPNAFIVLTSPVVLSSTLIPGDIAAN